ncbi:hypothetical protein SeMB42_g07502 [Synchytrium endobioticum]|uniref:Nuclear pore complex protein n=1 Tax=Synchytrium endobioticum TaxID=286115 RepID=A0A507C1I3_9FUNG|nr:hypothetical protein SeMB42_g07502 [Synchytrium endobioticum]
MDFPSRTPLNSRSNRPRYAPTPMSFASSVMLTPSKPRYEPDSDTPVPSSVKRERPPGNITPSCISLAKRALIPSTSSCEPLHRINIESNAWTYNTTDANVAGNTGCSPESADTSQDDLALVKSFQDFCDAKLRGLRSVHEADQARARLQKEEIHLWTLERHTWDLVQRLLEFRLGQPDEALIERAGRFHAYSGDWKLVQRASNLDTQLQERTLVVAWLEAIAPPFRGIEAQPGHWSNTAMHVPLGTVSDSIITQMDPDAPNRQKRRLVEEDQIYQEEFNKAIFECIRRGNHEKAWELADNSGHYWKTASMLGGILYRDSVLDDPASEDSDVMEDAIDEGNHNRDLWKAVCYTMANDESFDKYERALYAILSGDTQNALPVCETWEDVVWLHYRVLVGRDLEDALRQHPRSSNGDDAGDDMVTLRLPTQTKDPASIFMDLCHGTRPDLRDAANEQIRLLQSHFIMDRLDEYLQSLVALIPDSEVRKSMTFTKQLSTSLRMAVHLVLILRNAERPVNEDVSDLLIRKYIQMLISGRRHKHIALFTRSLPREEQTNVYSHFLADCMESKDVRHQYFRQAFQHGLDYHEICRQTVKIILERGILNEPIPPNALAVQLTSDLNHPVSDSDAVMIRALEWVAFEEQQLQDLVGYCNALLRRFLIQGRMNAAKETIKAVPHHVIPPQWAARRVTPQIQSDNISADRVKSKTEQLTEEYFQYFSLLEVYGLYGEWISETSRLPATGGNSGIMDPGLAAHVRKVTKELENKIMAFLNEEWILVGEVTDGSVNGDFDKDSRLLRELYIPEVVLILHRILFDTRDIEAGNLDKSLRIAEIVARPNGPWKEMRRANKLDAFMQLLRQSAMNALGSHSSTTPWSSSNTV